MKLPLPGTPAYHYDPSAPTLKAETFIDGDRELWRIWCEHCAAWHYHGAVRGHRIAHCKMPTPYTLTGYNLRPPADASRRAQA